MEKSCIIKQLQIKPVMFNGLKKTSFAFKYTISDLPMTQLTSYHLIYIYLLYIKQQTYFPESNKSIPLSMKYFFCF